MIYGERVKQARELRAWTQTELATRIGVSQSTIAYVENGRLPPKDDLLESIAIQTGFPPSFFRQPPDEDFPLGSLLYRSRASVTSREESKAYRYGQIGYRVVEKLLHRVKPFPVRLPALDDSPEIAAQATRIALGLSPDKPIPNLISSVERSGVIVLSMPVEFEGIDAFSVWAGPQQARPIIILSRTQDGGRLRFIIAHELAHLVMHRKLTGDLTEIEEEATKFSSELLLPAQTMREELVQPITLSSLAALKPRWRVSMQALLMRAFSLDLITVRQKKYLYQQLSARGWRTREPPNLDVPIEHPKALSQLAEMFYGKPVNLDKLAADVNLLPLFLRPFISAASDNGHGSQRAKVLEIERNRAV